MSHFTVTSTMNRLFIMWSCFYVLSDEISVANCFPENEYEDIHGGTKTPLGFEDIPGGGSGSRADDIHEDTQPPLRADDIHGLKITPGSGPLGADGDPQGLQRLAKAEQQFEPDFRRVLLDSWIPSVIRNLDFKINFRASSLIGIITFSQVLFRINPGLKTRGVPTHALTDSGREINYKYIITRSLFHSLYSVDSNSDHMKGIFNAGFGGLNMDVGLKVTKEQSGACKYESTINISRVPKSYTSKSNVISGFQDSNLTKKAEVIVNTYVMKDVLKNKDLAIIGKFSQHLKEAVDEKVGEKFRATINMEMCDFIK